MNRYLTALRSWAWPILVSMAVLTGFAIPGSDHPSVALWLSSAFAALSAAAFLLVAPEQPPLWQRPAVRHTLIAFGLFNLAVFVPLLVAAVKPVASAASRFMTPPPRSWRA